MGFSNFADYVTADKMVGSAANATSSAASSPRRRTKQAREYQQLLARKQEGRPGRDEVNFWK